MKTSTATETLTPKFYTYKFLAAGTPIGSTSAYYTVGNKLNPLSCK